MFTLCWCIGFKVKAQTLNLSSYSYANQSADVLLTGGLPIGGIYKVDNISTTYIKPTLLDGGIHTVTYTTTAGTATKSITITNAVAPTLVAANILGTVTNNATTAVATHSNKVMNIQGQYTINQNTTFNNVKLFASNSNAKIVVSPGKTLTINNGSRFYAFTSWKGIQITASTANSILTIQNSTIEDADIALETINQINNISDPLIANQYNVNFTIEGCVFNRNKLSIKLGNFYSGDDLNTITNGLPPIIPITNLKGNTFDVKNNWTNKYTISTKTGFDLIKAMVCDLNFSSTGGVTIILNGYLNASKPINFIKNMPFGIELNSGYLDLHSFNFNCRNVSTNFSSKLAFVGSGPSTGPAVSDSTASIAIKASNASCGITISNFTSAKTVKIDAGTHGIELLDDAFFDVRDIEFKNLKGIAISAIGGLISNLFWSSSNNGSTSGDVIISNCNFTNCLNGIYINGVTPQLFVSSNIFDNTNYTIYSTLLTSTAIRIVNPITATTFGFAVKPTVRSNTITAYHAGIVAENLIDFVRLTPGPILPLINLIGSQIFLNNITLLQNNSSTYSKTPIGIKISNSSGVLVSENTINGNKPLNYDTYNTSTTGIRTENISFSKVVCNNLNNLSFGLFLSGASIRVNVSQNVLNNYDYGLLWSYNFGFPGSTNDSILPKYAESNYESNLATGGAHTFAYYTLASTYYGSHCSGTAGSDQLCYASPSGPARIHGNTPLPLPFGVIESSPFLDLVGNVELNFCPASYCNAKNEFKLKNITNDNAKLKKGTADSIPFIDSLNFIGSLYNTLTNANQEWGYYATANKYFVEEMFCKKYNILDSLTKKNIDTSIINFASSLRQTNVQKILAIKESLKDVKAKNSLKSTLLKSSLTSIAKPDIIAQQYQILLPIVINNLENGTVLDSLQKVDLRNIAQLCALEYGDVVYMARSILNEYYNPVCEQAPNMTNNLATAKSAKQMSSLNNNNGTLNIKDKTLLQNKIIISPNPSNGFINIQAPIEVAYLKIYNSIGICIQTITLDNNKSNATLINQKGVFAFWFYTKDNEPLLVKKHLVLD